MSEDEQNRGVTGREGAPGREGVQGREGRRGVPGVGRRGEKGERGQTGAALPWRVRASFITLFVLSIGSSVASVISNHQLGNYARENRVLGVQGKQAHDALCEVKADRRRKIRASEAFLERHPNGIPGVPAKEIRKAIKEDRDSLDALKVNPCPSG